MEIQATENQIPLNELKKMIPREKLDSLTGKGLLKAYTLAHEGESRPKVLEEGKSQILKWPRKIISKITERVKPGTKFFARHNADNSTKGREAIGEVLASTVKEIGGKLSSVVIGHFPDRGKTYDYDVISMEASAEWGPDNIIQKIGEITGIAASSSKVDSPAFPGAVQLAQLQCFESGEEEKEMVTFEQVKQFVQQQKVWPHQLYEEKDLKDDRVFKKVFEVNEDLEKKNTELSKELEGTKGKVQELEDTSKNYLKKEQFSEGSKKLDEMLKEGYTEKQIKFIKKNYKADSFEEINEDTLKKFVDNQVKDYSEQAKFFGSDGESEGSESGEDNTNQDEDPIMKAMKEMEE